MSDVLTQSRAEDAVAAANDFLVFERGVELDGAEAQLDTVRRIETVAERANELLTQISHPRFEGLHVPLSKMNSDQFGEAAAVLPDHYVLVHSSIVDPSSAPAFYPAVMSEDGLKTDSIRLHVYQSPYHFSDSVSYGVDMMLSAAGQSETIGVGQHGRKPSDGVEIEHFSTLLAAGSDPFVQRAWGQGTHINHAWREKPNTSVTTEVSKRLFSEDDPQATLNVTREDIENGDVVLFWHESMRNEKGDPLTATKERALLVYQGLGFQALKMTNPAGIDNVKRMIA